MIRWLLACSLMLTCLLSVGCDEGDAQTGGDSKAANKVTQASTDAHKNLEDVKSSLTRARDSITKTQSIPSPAQSPKQAANAKQSPENKPASSSPEGTLDAKELEKVINGAKTELESVNARLGDLESALATQPESNEQIREAGTSVDRALVDLETASQVLASMTQNSSEDRSRLNESLRKALVSLNSKELTALNTMKIPDDLKASADWSDTLKEIGIWAAIIVASILGLLLLLATGRALIYSSVARADARIKSKIQPLSAAMQKQQAEVASQVADLTTSHNELRTRVADLEFEIKRVAKVARAAASDGAGRRSPVTAQAFTSFDEPVERDEPVFPISIGDYLTKMRSSSNIVRPDFQNDILVSDPGGTGELVLIRDATMPDDLQPLFVVPRATQFQTKQDFYTYYQKYYECARPSAGDVWIIDPAVVSKVSGGWQLREKGVLEVR